MPAPGPGKRPGAGGSSLATVAAMTTEESLVLNSDSGKTYGRIGHAITSLNPWTTIAIGLAVVNCVTSSVAVLAGMLLR